MKLIQSVRFNPKWGRCDFLAAFPVLFEPVVSREFWKFTAGATVKSLEGYADHAYFEPPLYVRFVMLEIGFLWLILCVSVRTRRELTCECEGGPHTEGPGG